MQKKQVKTAIIVVLVIVIAIIGLSFFLKKQNQDENIPDELYCESNADCVQAACCHANSCVNVNSKPDCSGFFCTQVCEEGTLDCGQGSCLCQNNRCKAVFNP